MLIERKCVKEGLDHNASLEKYGLSIEIIEESINYLYNILDTIDAKLIEAGGERLSELVELANLSAIIGNLFRGGIVQASEGKFAPNAPHTYPDLIAVDPSCKNIEIKIALENNKPKGHLVKPGPHIILRYVLGGYDGQYTLGKENRGNVAWVWEIRVGELIEDHFNVSNTEGDSGKTAVINADGMKSLDIVYCDLEKCPLSRKGSAYNKAATLFKT